MAGADTPVTSVSCARALGLGKPATIPERAEAARVGGEASGSTGQSFPRGAYRGSFVRRFNCTVASTASMRSPPSAMA
jgi:hypothetical protein